jgi:hypothetical protein
MEAKSLSPGSFNDFNGNIEQYTEALSAYRVAILSPELLGVTVIQVSDQSDVLAIQQRHKPIGD